MISFHRKESQILEAINPIAMEWCSGLPITREQPGNRALISKNSVSLSEIGNSYPQRGCCYPEKGIPMVEKKNPMSE